MPYDPLRSVNFVPSFLESPTITESTSLPRGFLGVEKNDLVFCLLNILLSVVGVLLMAFKPGSSMTCLAGHPCQMALAAAW